MSVKNHCINIVAMVLLFAGFHVPTEASVVPVMPGDSLTVSVLTCYPGEEIYELYGHTGLRIRSNSMDSVWNYGVFDFDQPNFVWRFSLGKTDYMVAAQSFDNFVRPYIADKREVVEQELNMTQAEAQRLLENLRTNALPENRTYRYNYLSDNCATRVFDQLNEAMTDSIPLNDPVRYNSYRDAMKRYHRDSRWYNLGIDLALSHGIDQPLTSQQQIFIPVELRRSLNKVTLPDGRKFVREQRVIFDAGNEFEREVTPDSLDPMFIFCIVNCIVAILCLIFVWRRKVYKWVYALFFGCIGICGVVLAYLVFVCEHPATSPNYLMMWINPLMLIFPMLIWSKKTSAKWVMYSFMMANIVAVVVFLCLWPLFDRYVNFSLFPLLISDVLLSMTFLLVYYKKVIPANLLQSFDSYIHVADSAKKK